MKNKERKLSKKDNQNKKKVVITIAIIAIIALVVIGIWLLIKQLSNQETQNTEQENIKIEPLSNDQSNMLSEPLTKERQYKQFTYKITGATQEMDENMDVRNTLKFEFTNNGEKTEDETIEIVFYDYDSEEIERVNAVLVGTEKGETIEIVIYAVREVIYANDVTINEVKNEEVPSEEQNTEIQNNEQTNNTEQNSEQSNTQNQNAEQQNTMEQNSDEQNTEEANNNQ